MLPEGDVSAAGGTFLAPGPVSRTADPRGGATGLSAPGEPPPGGETSKASSDTAGFREAGEGLLLGRTTFRSGVAVDGACARAGSRGRTVLGASFVLATAFFAEAFFG